MRLSKKLLSVFLCLTMLTSGLIIGNYSAQAAGAPPSNVMILLRSENLSANALVEFEVTGKNIEHGYWQVTQVDWDPLTGQLLIINGADLPIEENRTFSFIPPYPVDYRIYFHAENAYGSVDSLTYTLHIVEGYTVTFQPYRESVYTPIDLMSCTVSDRVKIPDVEPPMSAYYPGSDDDAYVFLGWSLNKNARSAQYTAGDYIYVDSDITLYPIWQKKGSDQGTHIHSEPVWRTTIQPTCLADGEKTGYCSGCGLAIAYEAVPKTGHSDGLWYTSVEATCQKAGKEVCNCIRCGKAYKEQTIEALGHDEGVWQTTVSATCTKAGEKSLSCTRCNTVIKTESVEPLGHDEGIWQTTVSATCTKEGEKSLVCTRCNTAIQAKKVDPLGHDEGIWIVSHQATCTAAGEEICKCTSCGATIDKREISALGHVYSDWSKNGNGTHSRTCSLCGNTETKNCTYTKTIQEPDCTHCGYTTCLCDVCGYTYTSNYTEALGHDFAAWVDDGNSMTHSKECSRCSEVETETHNWSNWNLNKDVKLFKNSTKTRHCFDCDAIETVEVKNSSIMARVFLPLLVFIGNVVNKAFYAVSLNWLFPWINIRVKH